MDVDSKYIGLIPNNVYAEIKATTVFGNKYVAFESPKDPSSQHISSSDVIDVSAVTTEFNTLFETVLSVAETFDPIKLNQTLTATAQALDGLGDRFGQSVAQGNEILADLNPQLPQIRYDTQRVADLADVYGNAAPDLFDGLENAVTTTATLNEQQANLDETLLASIGVGNVGADILERGGPYLVRSTADLISISEILDYNSPALFCTIRNFHDVEPKFSQAFGGNGFSGTGFGTIMGAGNPYVYPDNLPRVNARGGPRAARAVGRRSPAICGPPRIWCWTPARPSRRTTTSGSGSRCSSNMSGDARSGSTRSTPSRPTTAARRCAVSTCSVIKPSVNLSPPRRMPSTMCSQPIQLSLCAKASRRESSSTFLAGLVNGIRPRRRLRRPDFRNALS